MKRLPLVLIAFVFFFSACNFEQSKNNEQKESFKPSTNFLIKTFTKNEFVLETVGQMGTPYKRIMYYAEGVIVNNTDKNIINASLKAIASIVFENKTVTLDYNGRVFEFVEDISSNNVWRPNEKKHFQFELGEIKSIYLEYSPKSVQIGFAIVAEDPVGYNYDEIVNVYDINPEWQKLHE
jgi:hypothetical protein